MTPADERWADKIEKLLRKAEDPNIPQAEADSLFEKAQELMTKYAIDEAILRARRGIDESNEIVRETIHFHSIYSRALYYVGSAIAEANDCRVLIRKGNSLMKTDLIVIGFKSDVERVQMLNASVQIQCAAATAHFWRDYPDKDWLETERERFKVRREFIFSYAKGLKAKLNAAHDRGVHQAEVEYGDTGVALVLASKTERVDDWVSKQYPNLRSSRSRFASGGRLAREEGYAAGQRANVSADPQIRTNKKELEA